MSEDIADFRTKPWWNNRVKLLKGNLKDLIFNDDYREQFWNNVDNFLSKFSNYSATDIGCGYGRFAKHFTEYLGADFSDEMLRLFTEQNPDKKCIQARCLEPLPIKSDIVFEVNCLHSFGISKEDFCKFYKQFANVMVICVERNEVHIEWVYDKTDKELKLQ
jgi:SAM-dependent methyltransferase